MNIPISYIKKANVKLIERKYYIELNKQKDSIINYKNQYINAQSMIIDTLSTDYYNTIKVNENIKNSLIKEQERTNKFIYTTIGATALLLISILIK